MRPQAEPLDDVIARLIAKVEARAEDLRCQALLRESENELHIAIYHPDMGKRHRPARDTIGRCVRQSHRLSRMTVYLYLNPRSTGKSCTTFVRSPKAQVWESGCSRELPYEELVA